MGESRALTLVTRSGVATAEHDVSREFPKLVTSQAAAPVGKSSPRASGGARDGTFLLLIYLFSAFLGPGESRDFLGKIISMRKSLYFFFSFFGGEVNFFLLFWRMYIKSGKEKGNAS